MKLTFATLKRGADTIGRDCQAAHDLFRQSDPDALHVLDLLVEDCARLAKEAAELRANILDQRADAANSLLASRQCQT